jgi:pimeloyl-ACP methyl ester carboxylesterase
MYPSPYAGSGPGAGGKIRRHPTTRAASTPYERPLAAAAAHRLAAVAAAASASSGKGGNGGRSSGWVSRLVDPASRLIAGGATFTSFRADHLPPLPCFLYGESLGGAIALLLHLRRKDLWRDGAILNGAMCGVSPRFKPQWPLEHLLATAAAVVPTWRVAYTRSNIRLAATATHHDAAQGSHGARAPPRLPRAPGTVRGGGGAAPRRARRRRHEEVEIS